MCLSLYNARLRRNNQRDNFHTALKGMTILLDTLLARSNCNNHNCSIFSCRFFHLQTKITIPRINSISITKITPIAISVKKNDNSNIHLTSIWRSQDVNITFCDGRMKRTCLTYNVVSTSVLHPSDVHKTSI